MSYFLSEKRFNRIRVELEKDSYCSLEILLKEINNTFEYDDFEIDRFTKLMYLLIDRKDYDYLINFAKLNRFLFSMEIPNKHFFVKKSALCYACEKISDLNVLQRLFNSIYVKNAFVDVHTDNENMPTIAAYLSKNYEALDMIAKNKYFSNKTFFHDFSALQFAAYNNDRKLASILVKYYDVDIVGEFGFTALCIATIEDNFEMAEILLAAGANPNKTSHEGLTPLQYCHSDKIEALLLEYDAKEKNDENYAFFTILKAIRLNQNVSDDLIKNVIELSKNDYIVDDIDLISKIIENNRTDLFEKLVPNYNCLNNGNRIIKEILNNSEIDINCIVKYFSFLKENNFFFGQSFDKSNIWLAIMKNKAITDNKNELGFIALDNLREMGLDVNQTVIHLSIMAESEFMFDYFISRKIDIDMIDNADDYGISSLLIVPPKYALRIEKKYDEKLIDFWNKYLKSNCNPNYSINGENIIDRIRFAEYMMEKEKAFALATKIIIDYSNQYKVTG